MKSIPAIVEKDFDIEQVVAALSALDPEARERVLRAAGIDPGPRSWTTTGRKLGVPQEHYGGHVVAAWPAEVVRSHRVYFIQAGDAEPWARALVKIGFTTYIEQRLSQLQTASPLPLKLLDVTIGTHAIEAFFHRLLRRHWVRGEWFRLHPDDVSYALGCLWEEGLSWW